VRDEVRAVGNRHVPRELGIARELERIGFGVERRRGEWRSIARRMTRPDAQPCERDRRLGLEREIVLADAEAALADRRRDDLPAGLEHDRRELGLADVHDQLLFRIGVHAQRDLLRRFVRRDGQRDLERCESIGDGRTLAVDRVAEPPMHRRQAESHEPREADVAGIDHELAGDRAMRGVAIIDEVERGVLDARWLRGRRRRIGGDHRSVDRARGGIARCVLLRAARREQRQRDQRAHAQLSRDSHAWRNACAARTPRCCSAC
jgi:hypothetical protein